MKQNFELLTIPVAPNLSEEFNTEKNNTIIINYIRTLSDGVKEPIKTLLKNYTDVIEKYYQIQGPRPYYIGSSDLDAFGFYRMNGGIYWNIHSIGRLPPSTNSLFLSSFLYCMGLNIASQKKGISDAEIFAAGNIWAAILFVYFGYTYGIKLDTLKTEQFSALIMLYIYYTYTGKTDLNEYLKFVISRRNYLKMRPDLIHFNIESFSSVKNFLQTLEYNGLTEKLSIGNFSATLLNPIGIMGLMAFESYQHFYAWILSASLPNALVSSNLFKNNKESLNHLIGLYSANAIRYNIENIVGSPNEISQSI